MKRLIPGLLAFLTAFQLSAQITLTDADIGAVGSSYIMGIDNSLDSTFTLGGDGPNQSWDFSSLGVDGVDTIGFLDPANTPYGADFPTSNLSISQPDLGGYGYLEYDAQSLSIIGLAGDPANVGQTFIIPLEDPQVIAQFPFTYGSTLVDTSIFDISAPFTAVPFTDSVRYRSTAVRTLDADSYGDLILPDGNHNTLRVRTITNTLDSIWIHVPFLGWSLFQDSTYTDSTFTWWENGSGYILCEASFDGPDLSSITYQGPVIVGKPVPTQVQFQAFPNPANDNLVVRREKPVPANFELYDQMGRLILTVESRELETILPVNDLPEGAYILRVQDQKSQASHSGTVIISHK